jgi:hypothetical protein
VARADRHGLAPPIATFAAVPDGGPDGATAIAELIAAHVPAGIRWRRSTPIGTGVRLEFLVGRRMVPAFIGPAASDSPDAGRWFVSVGSSSMPFAKLVGGKDRDLRVHVADALRSALLASPGLVAIQRHDDD